tara:strand:+ start:299 stop:436 length:138 start_codon:yes stop_codon:yes gene_type:complete
MKIAGFTVLTTFEVHDYQPNARLPCLRNPRDTLKSVVANDLVNKR